MITLALIVAGTTLVAGLTGALALRLLNSVHWRLIGLALLAGLLPLAAVVLSGITMFHMGADAVILAVTAASSSVAVGGALLVTRSISSPLRGLRNAARRIAGGDFGTRVSQEGPNELAELSAAFNEMAAHLESLFDARRELVAWASHDLRTPLTALQSTLEAVEDGVVDAGHYLPAMRENMRILRHLVDDLFELAQIDAAAVMLNRRDVRVESVVEACLNGLRSEATAQGVHLAVQFGGDLPSVWVAPEKVERILLNLLTNALRVTPRDGSVVITAESRDRTVVMAVEDSGHGIPVEHERRIFDPFWRGDPVRSPGHDGAGLGLAIAKGLVEAHGGRIWAESRAGGGARIAFTIPASTPDTTAA